VRNSYQKRTDDKTLDALRNKLITEMELVFGIDQKRISHAMSVLGYAKQILAEEGGDPVVVIAAAILHDIGIHQAEQKYGSSAGKYQEIAGPPIARAILEQTDLTERTIDHICRIVGSHHSGRDIDTIEFRVVWDADWLVNINGEYGHLGDKEKAKLIAKVCRTPTGLKLAQAL
jgi:HD domain